MRDWQTKPMAGGDLQASVKRICARADRIAARTPAAYLAAMLRYMEPEPDDPRIAIERDG